MRDDPDALMLFAAGLGTRMGALTAGRPKPLIPVAGRPLLDHALAVADAAGISRIVVNTHYFAEQIEAHLADRSDIAISREPGELLDTGGGLRQALPLLGAETVFTMNSDAVWTGQNPLVQLRQAWDPAHMDALLLLVPRKAAVGHAGPGDFHLGPDGKLTRGPGLVFTGAQIVRTGGLKTIPDHAFSLNLLWDSILLDERAYGIVHQGGWCDVGSPEGIALAERMLRGAEDV